MYLPVSLGNGVDAEQAVLTALRDHVRTIAPQSIAVNAAVDHDVRDVDALRAKFARHALCQHAQAGLGRCEVGESGFAAQAARCAGEQYRAAPQWNEPARRFPSHQEAAEAADAPEVFEHFRRQVAEIQLAVVACVVGDKVERIPSGAGRRGAIEQANDILFACRVRQYRFRAATFRRNGVHDLFDLVRASSSAHPVVAAFCKAAAKRRSETKLRADADYDCDWLTHRASLSSSTKSPFIRLVHGSRSGRDFARKTCSPW